MRLQKLQSWLNSLWLLLLDYYTDVCGGGGGDDDDSNYAYGNGVDGDNSDGGSIDDDGCGIDLERVLDEGNPRERYCSYPQHYPWSSERQSFAILWFSVRDSHRRWPICVSSR